MKKNLLLFALLLLISGAMFGQVTYTVTVLPNDESYGSVNPVTVTDVPYGTVITQNGNTLSINETTVTATPADATSQYTYAFDSWSGIPESVTENVTITANFTRTTNTFTVTLSSNNGEYGSVTPASVNEVPYGTVITQNGNTLSINGTTVTATPADATSQYTYAFDSWSGIPESVTENVTITANFTRTTNTFTVTLSSNNGEYGSVTPASVSEVPYGTVITQNGNTLSINGTTVTATPADATSQYTYAFDSWSGIPESVTENVTITANFTRTANNFTVTLSSNNGEYGSVTPASVSEVPYGTVITQNGNRLNINGTTVTATPADATSQYTYAFDSWSGIPESVTENVTITANFTRTVNSYTISVSADPTNGGNVSGGGTYNYGETCTLTATPASGFNFINWTKDGAQVSTTQTYSFTVTSEGTYIAHFSSENYIITAYADPSEGGTVSGGGGFNYGDQCTLRATANTGYTFVNWTKNGQPVSTNPTYTFNVTETATYIAHFQAQTYTITATADPANGGNVSGGGTYNHGATCTLTATANTGYRFVNWTKNGQQVSTSPDYSFTVTSSGTYVAHFQIQTYTITATADPTNGGNVSGGGTYNHGATCTLTATSHTGYQFVNWTKNGQPVSSSPTYSFTVTSSGNYVAHFTQQQCTITVSASPIDGGSVYVGNNPGTTQGTYNNGQSCTVHARANSGFTFVKWTENNVQVSTNEDYTFTVDSNRDLVAHFTQQQYVITAEADPPQGGHVEGSGGYDHGETCELSATPNEGYDFINWTKDGVVVTTDTTFSFEVTESATYVAHFRIKTYNIKAEANPAAGGEVSGFGEYNYGETCRLIATANPGYHFVNWTEDGIEVSNQEEYPFIVYQDRYLVANFEEQPETYTIKVSADPTNGGSVYVGDAPGTTQSTYTNGQNCTVHARANTGYNFVNWTENGAPVSTEADYTFTVTGNRNLVAHFTQAQPDQYIITVSANPSNGGSAYVGNTPGTTQDTYTDGQTCIVHATANPGYLFVNWTENGQVASEQANYTFTVNGNRTLEANFVQEQPEQYVITVNEPTEGGTVTVDQNEASPGTIITITVNTDDGYELETLSVYKTNDPSQQVPVTNNQFSMPAYDVTVMAKFKPIGIHIDTPDPICAGESLDLTEPSIPWPLHGEWQLSETYDFEQPIPYTTGQTLEANYDGWYLRYHAYNQFIGNTYSNKVQITVRSLDGFVLQGNTSANLNQEVEYQVYIDGVDDYADYSFNWSVSDAQAVTTITANSLKVIWKTIGQHQVSVTVTDNIAGCTDTFSINITVTGCIENIQAIQPKYHKEDYEYILILVYPNVDNEGNPSNEEYDYQWQYSPDGVQDYLDLDEGTSKNQYYYIGGPLKDGYYKVRINRKGEDECFGETEAYPVFNNRQLRIYPNPSRRGSEIMVMNDCNGPALLTIYSTDGRVLHTQTVTDSQATIGISLPQGVYVAYLTNKDGYTKVGKLIIH